MANCILAGGDNIGLAFEQMGVTNYRGDYNLFHNDNPDRAIAVGYTDEFTLDQVNNGAWTSYSGQDAHSVVVPSEAGLFVDASQADFHLLQNSPAVDHGTLPGAPAEDFEGAPRPAGVGVDIGAFEFHIPDEVLATSIKRPANLNLHQNYPNPFNATTTIEFSTHDRGRVKLVLFDIQGRELATVFNAIVDPGVHKIRFDANTLHSGFYLILLKQNGEMRLHKIVLVK